MRKATLGALGLPCNANESGATLQWADDNKSRTGRTGGPFARRCRANTTKLPFEPIDVGEVGDPAVVEGIRGQWRVDPAQLGQPFAGRAALLSPFDRLLADRKRMSELFEFDYILEMYKPASARMWGYYALPILYGDRLVGKLDARADHQEGELRVAAVHRDVPFSTAMTAAVDGEIRDLARWLDLELVRPG